jgi:hypothetical protein
MTITSDELASPAQPAVPTPDDPRHLYDGRATSIDALSREAKRRRRRRRQAKTAAGLALVLLAATIGVVAGRGGTHRSPTAAVSWTAHQIPRAKAVATYAAANRLPGKRFPLGTVSPSAWKLFIGPTL